MFHFENGDTFSIFTLRANRFQILPTKRRACWSSVIRRVTYEDDKSTVIEDAKIVHERSEGDVADGEPSDEGGADPEAAVWKRSGKATDPEERTPDVVEIRKNARKFTSLSLESRAKWAKVVVRKT